MFCPHCGNGMSEKKTFDDRHYELTCVNCKSKLFVKISYYTGLPTQATWFRDEWRKDENGRWILRL